MEEQSNIEKLFGALELVANENHLEKKEVFEILENAIFKAFHTKFDPDAELVLNIDEEKKVFELINNTTIVIDDEVDEKYRAIEIPLVDAKKVNKNAKDGDVISQPIPFELYAREVSGLIRQMLTQTVREKKKAAVYAKYKGLVGEMILVTATSVSNNHAIFSLDDGTTAFMPETLMNKKIKIAIGEKLNIYVEDVLEDSRDAQIIVSNGSPQMIKRILEVEVPEIADGTIEVIKISRVAGERAKIAVKSENPEVDPVGAIIGAGGERIKSIIATLDGEKIDVIKYSSDINEFISAAMSPARVVSINEVKRDDGSVKEKHRKIITPDRHQTLAIGRRGINIKLAADLLGFRLDVLSIKEAKELDMDILWNGNVKESELDAIENGEGRNFVKRSGSSRGNRVDKTPAFNDAGFADEISSFNEDMNADFAQEVDDAFEISEDLFAKLEENSKPEPKEELQEISEDDFNFDFTDINDDFK